MLEIHTLVVSPFQSNCHIVRDTERDELLVVDPGDDGDDIIAELRRLGGRVVAIWNTHAHIDHINANAAVVAETKAPIWIHELEAQWLESPIHSGAALFGLPFHPSKAAGTWGGGEAVQVLGRTWRIHHTPGHSPGSCSLVCAEEKVMLGGDLLFQGSIGRMDLPGGDPAAMTESLRALFNQWGQDDWTVYCGHGPKTTIADERRWNMLVREALETGFDHF